MCTTTDEQDEIEEKHKHPYEVERSFVLLHGALPDSKKKHKKLKATSSLRSRAKHFSFFEHERVPWVYG